MTELASLYQLPQVYDWSVYAGDSKEFTVSLATGPDDPSVDFTGANFEFRSELAADRLPGTNEIATCEVTATAPGVLRVFLTDSESDKLRSVITGRRPVKVQWDLQVTRLDPRFRFTLLTGTVTVSGDVTRDAA